MDRELKKLREDYANGERFYDTDINDITTDINLLIDKTEEIDNDKQDKLTAGDNITLSSNNTISAVDTTYVASDFDIKDLSDSTGLRNKWSGKQDKLTPGSNVTIDSANTISAVDTTYVASDFDIKDLSDSTDLRTEWSGKQDALTAGAGIDIDSANTISCTVNLQDIINDMVISTGSTYSSEKIRELIGEIAQFNVEVVDELPSTGDEHTIYFVPAESGDTPDDYYNEYMYIDGEWELIGNTRIDLSNYYTKTEVNDLLSGKSNTGHTHTKSEITDFAHTHVIGDVSGLTEELDSKADKVQPVPLCFTAQESGCTIGINNNVGSAENTPNIEISTDGSTWNTWNYSAVTLANSGDTLYMRGMNTSGFSVSDSKISTFTMTGRTAVSGNVMSLIDYTRWVDTIPCDYCFSTLFSNCTGLTTSPELPATTLTRYCYGNMFMQCTSLTTAPELPAAVLDYGCYYFMFAMCTGLTTASELPATKLDEGCYAYMFAGCSNLTSTPELPATTLVNGCYTNMFYGCSSLTVSPVLPALKIVEHCYSGMFGGCSGLTTAPELSASSLREGCYYQMFKGCTNLNYIKCLATDISATNCVTDWVSGVTTGGTFVKESTMTGWTLDSTSGIPSGWTVVDHYDDVALYNKVNVLKETISNDVSGKTLEPNKLYVFTGRTNSLTLSLATPVNNNIENIYHFVLECGATAPTVTFSGVQLVWAGSAPTWEANKTFEISIMENKAVWVKYG